MNNLYFGMEDSSNGNVECLYSTVQTVYFKCAKKRDRDLFLRFTLTMSKKTISLQLTDDDDPYLLFCLVITEEDFKLIKVQQSLLVDFENFPGQLVKLLEQCKADIGTQGPRFLLVLESKEEGPSAKSMCLKIIETNLFKHLCHLDLNITSGRDADVMKLMALQIKKLKDESSSRLQEVVLASSRLNECTQHMESKRVEDERQIKQWEEAKKDMVLKLNAEISKEKEKLFSAKRQWQADEKQQRQHMQFQHDMTIKSLEAKISELTLQNRSLLEKNCELDSIKREHSNNLELFEKNTIKLQNEIASLRMQNSKLDHDYHEGSKLANNQKTRVVELDQELKDNKEILRKQQELLKTIHDQKVRCEESLRDQEAALERKQTTLNKVSDDLLKANEIILMLQADLDLVDSKVHKRTHIALEQERLLGTKIQELVKSEAMVGELRQKIEDGAKKEQNLNLLLAASNERVIALEKQISENKLMMEWVAREMKNSSIVRPGLTTTQDLTSGRLNTNPGYQPPHTSEQLPPFMYAGAQNHPYLAEHWKTGNTSSDLASPELPEFHGTSKPSTSQQPLECVSSAAHPASTGQPQTNEIASGLTTYQQPAAYKTDYATGFTQSYVAPQLTEYRQPPLNVDMKTDYSTAKRVTKSNIAARLGAYQQRPISAASKTSYATATGVTKSNVKARLNAYQQPNLNAATKTDYASATGVTNSNINARLNAYQQPNLNAATKTDYASATGVTKSNVNARLAAYQQSNLNAAINATVPNPNWYLRSTVSSQLPANQFVVTHKGSTKQTHPATSAYFPKSVNE